MTGMAQSQLTETLTELEALHHVETDVLTNLRHSALDEITELKLALCSKLEELAKSAPPEPAQRESIERIKRLAFKNRLLAVHARDAVRTILTEAGVTTARQFGSHRPMAVQDGVRVNFRT